MIITALSGVKGQYPILPIHLHKCQWFFTEANTALEGALDLQGWRSVI